MYSDQKKNQSMSLHDMFKGVVCHLLKLVQFHRTYPFTENHPWMNAHLRYFGEAVEDIISKWLDSQII